MKIDFTQLWKAAAMASFLLNEENSRVVLTAYLAWVRWWLWETKEAK